MKLTHFDEKGNARMVDVAEKDVTERRAVARGCIKMSQQAYAAVIEGCVAKGDVLTVATTAGIMAAKKTWELIPMCHLLPLAGLSVDWMLDDIHCIITCICTAKSSGKTGVEMEALTGVSVALLTVYDMCKAMDKFMEIGEIHLEEKEGGKSGHVIFREKKLHQ
ncbi:cyclic pyranopterin monophosphate synthase MoaC [Anaerovoracaceae bacterium 41-7]|uniref:cyclic pyranopterin monophosphate synthase MoaC n=1 Tax=Anaerovoracaceae TaxID=543314 RepID=UPI00204191C6|nr:cyclic pyranopterin monophosphate synthase MoaC [Senimuribacter intestinalis]MCI9476581.1 cyclic pyranopterin monophosphate synthase MoaC [Emergencia sp.]